MAAKIGPIQTRLGMVALTEEQTRRLRHFVASVGSNRVAIERLGLSKTTFENAFDRGLMRPVTRDKVLEALEREEKR